MDGIYVFLSFVLGWFVSQVLKLIFFIVEKKGKTTIGDVLYYTVKSGGMPSGHTASFTAVTVTIGNVSGFDSVVFALAVCMTSIIIYDAINVRYAAGEQGKILNKLIEDKNKIENTKMRKTRVVEGHKLGEVVVGALIGLLIATIIKISCL
mgnify:CR=1 FL=1